MLLIPDSRLAERRRQSREGDLAALYDSLAAELEPLLGAELYVPREKALLSRAGGRCERDGTTLEFDPWSPREHRCPTCGTPHRGELHDRAWIMPYQMWLAERAVHAALFAALRGDQRHAALARDILTRYADVYLKYPNVDNVLGPSRPFFSTYLESIWLLQICFAADLLADASLKATVADRIIEPSCRLIAEFPEGMSNRQVWNNAALIAAAAALDDSSEVEWRVRDRETGLSSHLDAALLRDGTWYEGENYHQFALRGLWYGVAMAEAAGVDIDASLRDRFERAFEVLYLTALPDFTMPSRKDSQYAVSLRQWRMAELAELGFARRQSPVLAAALARTYEPGHPRGETGRSRSTADVERNAPASALSRSDLGWRALLFAAPSLPRTATRQPQSAILEEQGLAIFRRAPDVYVSLDYGRYGGGHGHPDRLNLNLAAGDARLLDDLGTGSYVDPSLHWYRSTLAHNAPLVGGESQPEHDGVLLAHDERGALGWTVAAVEWSQPKVRIERTIVVAPDYVIDEVSWTAADGVRVELPWHLDGKTNLALQPSALDGGDGLEDGFVFVKESVSAPLSAGSIVRINGEMRLRAFHAWMTAGADAQLFRARAPGQPSSKQQTFHLIRGDGRAGRLRAVVAWSELGSVAFTDAGVEVRLPDGSRHVHRSDAQGWHVELFALDARSSVDLAGFRQLSREKGPAPLQAVSQPRELGTYELGEAHYRRSELNWRDAGSPAATLKVAGDRRTLRLSIDVRAADQRFLARDARNPYDNEHPDTMAAGVELFTRVNGMRGAWLLVPEQGNGVRVRTVTGWTELPAQPSAQWRENAHGYSMTVELDLQGAREIQLDVLVNETTHGRERRRGQLVLSGAEGEFVYLRGDRHDEKRLLTFRLS